MSLHRHPGHRGRHLTGWQIALRTGVAGLAVATAQTAYANPSGGQVVAGQATINGQGTGRVRIDQASDRVVINWDNFSIDLGEGVDFRQPNARSVALNRVTGPEISQILGELTANGQVYLINGNGIVFGKDAKVDVAGLVATSADIGNEAFMAGGPLRFGTPGRAGARITNHGSITVRDAGIAAFVAPQVANDGVITAHMGRIAFGGAQAFTLDLHGDNLIRFQVGDAVTKLDDKGALVGMDGVVDARGGSVLITASAARDLVNQSVRIGTPQAASMQTGPDGKVSLVAAKVAITAPGEVQVGRNVAMDLSSATNAVTTGSAKGKGGQGSAGTESNIGWVGSLGGDGSAPGQAMAASGTGGTLTISAARTILDGTINLDGSKAGGTAHITGSDFLSFGSVLSASGQDAGGKIQLDAGGFSLAGRITVNAALGKGGSVDIRTSRRAIDTGDAFIDASGLHGGSIRYVSDDQIISSGRFRASGSHGFGGAIDVSAPRLDLFSAQFYAQGGIRGGRVQLGGEFQGGKNLTADELPNALRLVATDAVTIDVSAIGMRGNAGEIVIWSDEKTTFLGNAIARGGLVGGVGGQIEISGKETLVYRGTVETARDGQRGGTLLLDPKNIIIADGTNASSQYSLVLQAFASNFPAAVAPQPGIEAGDGLDLSVSLDGNRLALGVRGDDGFGNALTNAGAVYLFSFADASFATPVLNAVIGSGYSGGKNLSLAQLEANDIFGHSVSLDGNRLAVSARGDDGNGNGATDAGAVYLFTFTDAAFAGGQLRATLGVGYTGGSNLAVDNLEAGDIFGQKISLDGNRLAVGAIFDDGATNGVQDAGAVYLFTFASSDFATPSLSGIMGQGYATRANDVSLALDIEDFFGGGVSLDGNRIAIGAYGDDGVGNSLPGGAVYLYTFADAAFSGAVLRSRIGGGYDGPDDFNLPNLDGIGRDHFGDAVSLDGNRLAILSRLDDGQADGVPDSGAVYLFTFADASFSTPDLAARIGIDYGVLGGRNLSIEGMEAGDTLGDVALSGKRLVIASVGDDGRNNSLADSGAVYLFTFADDQFSGGRQVGILGAGYTPIAGLSLSGDGLEQQDQYGTAVALSGTRMVVGVPRDDGRDNILEDAGAVYLFTFGDVRFSAPVLQGIIGTGYSGGKNISVDRLGAGDLFGSSVALDGARLAVGAPGDDGLINSARDAGAVYLFTFAEGEYVGGALAQVLSFESFAPDSINSIDARFGSAVSFSNNVIAVGANGDGGNDPMAPIANAGAVHIIDLVDAAFTQPPVLLSTIGKGYDGGNNIDIADLGEDDRFGSAVSLDGLRLAVGAPGDDGFNDDFFDTGAAFLFTFNGGNFTLGSLTATIGAFYPGLLDFTPAGIGTGATDQDFFGTSLSLKGLQLAVGAPGDDGALDTQNNAGAIYLLAFSDPGFNDITQIGQIGADYAGGNSFSIKLAKGEAFGTALALDGDRLVVGAPGNAGAGSSAPQSGATYLLAFAGANFSEARLIDTLGFGFEGSRNVSVAGLANSANPSGAQFGAAVALDGRRLAVGVPGDTGANPSASPFGEGAVYLFSFANLGFGAPVLEAIIGEGYSGGKNISMPADFGGGFGRAVALDGNRLAVGAPQHSGNGDPLGVGVGTVYLFTFSDALFTGGSLVGRIGQGYSGGQNIGVAGLDNFDAFGSSVSLRGTLLAVGAPGDDGDGNSTPDSGGVYLFSFTDTAFNGGTREAYIAFGAAGSAKDINFNQLDSNDLFGSAVALTGSGGSLFVGAPGDGGNDAGGPVASSGAVFQFDFGTANFGSGAYVGAFGFGYTNSGDVNVSTLAANDRFGSALALDGVRLAIGAPGESGSGIGGPLEASGAVYLFSKLSTFYSLSGTIGAGFGGDADTTIGNLDAGDQFGSAVALNQDRLVVGAPGDAGFADAQFGAGAVYLFSFANNPFAPAILAGTMGAGYAAQSNSSSLLIGSGNNFGSAISLRDNRLAVGVPGNSGASGGGSDMGAVFLFTFLNSDFAAPVLQGVIGQGFSGVNNFDVGVLEDFDQFGAAVSIDGLRLAVGAPGDDGAANDLESAGAVYLFSFADMAFGSPVLEARMGRGYTGFKNVNVADLEENGAFGASVALQGQQLAVGSPGHDFDGDLGVSRGAVFLYTFTNSIFNGGERAGTIGFGYNTLAADFDLAALAPGDLLGSSVSISGLGLAIGAVGDAGISNLDEEAGAVYLFTFADTGFGGLSLAATIGRGYDGPGDLSVGGVDPGDRFGSAVSLEGTLLAIGSARDSGVNGDRQGAGAVYLLSFLDTAFSGPVVSGIVGSGYSGANSDLTVIGLDPSDGFGAGVAIDAGRLVVGAPGDDGQSVGEDNFGTFYQFTYAGNFLGLAQIGQVGNGYYSGPTGSLSAPGLAANEQFGAAVSLRGLRLAIGSPLDSGAAGTTNSAGAVYLLTFADLDFNAPVLQSIIGLGYSGGKNVSVPALTAGDRFGVSVSLGTGNVLAVGADSDDGVDDTKIDAGAVYLFSFSDALFSGGALTGTIGSGYGGLGSLNVALDIDDFFGSAVSIDANNLVVGAPGDDGIGNTGATNGGAAYLFNINPATSAISQVGIIGNGYTGTNDINLTNLQGQDGVGSSVSLSGRRLAVGAPFDRGNPASVSFFGAVYTFLFADDQLGGGNQRSVIGKGYTGPNDLDVANIGVSDFFGSSVSLDGNRLAVGSRQDSGALNTLTAPGAVYLFSFADAQLSTPTQEAIIGVDYTGGKNLAVALDAIDVFGSSVSLDGNRLAVGSLLDDGPGNGVADSGAVFLFTFADAAFNGGRLVGKLGAGYSASVALDLVAPVTPSFVQLGAGDRFGNAVSLDGLRLAIGAPFDDGSLDSQADAGAVYLFSFTDLQFGGAALQSVIGHGFVGGKNIFLTQLDAGDQFGLSVSLDSQRLAVGAPGDDGETNAFSNSGAVYLFSFTDLQFGGGALQAIGGADFTGGKNFQIAGIGPGSDRFGSAVSLDGNRIAVGVPLDDSNSGSNPDRGAVYLFSFSSATFDGATLEATLGAGYVGGKNLDIALDDGDNFGFSVSLDGLRLAVGAIGDDSSDNGMAEAGAVYLYTFADLNFSGGLQRGVVGVGYTGPGNVEAVVAPFVFRSNSLLGSSVSLDGNRLAIGGPSIFAGATSPTASGAVYLLTFADSSFSGGAVADILGSAFDNFGINPDFDVKLDAFDNFGSAVSLDGNRLVVGASDDDGLGNPGAVDNAGAVYLFTFTDAGFGGAQLRGNIGSGYTRGLSTPVSGIDADDRFGAALSLDGNRLAIGAPGDDGGSVSFADAGAVYLFSFADADFASPVLQGIVGRGYSGGKNVSVPQLIESAAFGSAVSLDGIRLAVGAPGDTGAIRGAPNSGAVYLFTFADTDFNSGGLQGIVGAGYTGGNNLSLSLDNDDRFGSSVSLRGNQLAVGAVGDDGQGNASANSGAAYLITFTDPQLLGASLVGRIGNGYAGTGDFNLAALDSGDGFGASLSLDGLRLAVGATGDDGASNGIASAGAVHLFTFADNAFATPTLARTLGAGYAGANAVTGLETGDLFGSAVALRGAVLAVGAPGDRGAGNEQAGTGAAYLFAVPGASFADNPSLTARIGRGYNGAADINLTGLGVADLFASALTLDGGRLVVGAPGDDGPENLIGNSGAVYFFNTASAIPLPGLGFDDDPGADVTISASALAAILSGGTAVTLQANNDITVNSAILVNNPSGDGGFLSLEAGRSILVNAGITTDNGFLSISANVLSNAGLLGGFRDLGAADIVFGPGGFIDAGTSEVFIGTFTDVAGSNYQRGTITLGNVTAGIISVRGGSEGASVRGGEVIIPSGVVLAASGTGDAITISSGLFTNNGGSGALVLTGGGRFRVFSDDYDSIARGGLVGNNLYNRNLGSSITQPGNLFIFRRQPILTFTANDASRFYGDANPPFSALFAGLVNGDTDTYAFAGAPDFSTTATIASNVGTYAINPILGTLTSDVGYGFAFAPGTLTINKWLLNVAIGNAFREYGEANPTFTASFGGLRNGDDESVVSGLILSTAATATSPAGTYVINGSGATATNYDFNYLPGTLTVARATLSVTANNASREYGLANPGFTATIIGFRNGEDASVISGLSFNTIATLTSAAGTYSIVPSGASATNYNFNYFPGTLTITKALLTVTADNASREYGLANPTFTGSITGFRNGDTASVISGLTYGTVATTASPVGTYAITGSGGTATNYDFSYVPGTLTITKALLTVTADNASREYGLANPTFTGSITGFRNGDTASVISGLTYGSVATIASNVGTYAITGSGASATNYDFSYVPGTLTITRALLTVTADNASREYGLANPTFTGSITGFRNGDTASVISGLTYGTVATTASAVGTYAITGSGGTATNYDFSYVPGTLTITKALLTVTADNASREYGLANPTFTGSITGFRNGDTASVVSGLTYGTVATTASPVGTYAITGSGATATNYDFSYVPGTLTITRALLTVTADNASREYGLANPTFTGSITGFRNGDTASVISGLTYGTVATTASPVGTYAITGSGGTATNYDFSYVPGTLTITRALLTVTADNASREYGLANPTFTGSITGFRNGDTASVISGLTYGSVATIASNVGTYAITGSGGTATNYDFSYVPGTLTITRALLTVTADNASREYGLANPTFTGSITGFRNGDTASVISGLTYGSVATIASNVGSYAITGSGGTATNYDFAYVPGTLTITRALLTATANNASREYGLANPTFTGSITGFRNGDTASVVSGLTYGSVATIASNVGSYAITGSGATATNYDFAYVPGTLTITRALLTVTADNASREYGLANPVFTGSITGYRNGDTASVISGLTYGTVATSASPVGTYAITGSGGTAANYDFSYVPGTLTITKALLTVTADNASREYGLANPAFTGSITGFRNGDTAGVVSGLTYGTVATIGSNAGTYAITGSGGTATNYDFSYVPGTLTITRALLTVTADNASREYGLANPTFTGSITGFRNGDTASVISGLTYGTVATSASPVGTYAISGSGGTASNYDFSYVPGTLTITRALLTVTADNASREYGLANPAFAGTITGFRNGDTASVVSGLTYGSVATIASNVGSYAITGSGGTATNYDFAYVPGTLTITRALLTVTANNASREYGLANPVFTGTIAGLRNGDTASVISGLVYGTSAVTGSNVGNYAITASGAAATNYDFAYAPGTLTITKALLTVTAEGKAREYGLANPALTSTISGLRNGDTASVVSGLVLATAATQASGVGNYAITASGGSALNYDFAYVPGTLVINPATLTVAIDSKTRTYGAPNPALTASVTGFRNGDTEQVVGGLRLSTDANARSNVGNYVIAGSGATAANYRFDYVPGTLTITKALLQVRVNDARREYGLANPAFSASISGFRNGDNAGVVTGLTFGTPATIGSDVGLYAITASGGSALNYDFTYIPGRLTISQAQLLITADSKTMTQGAGDPILTVSYSGLRNGDTGSVVTGLVLRTSGGGNAAPGQYIINASRGSARNYQITYRPGVMTVLPAITPPAQDPPGTGGSPNPPGGATPPTGTTPPVITTLPPTTLPIAGGNANPPASAAPPASGSATPGPATAAGSANAGGTGAAVTPLAEQQPGPAAQAPIAAPSAVIAMPPQGSVSLPVAPDSATPLQVLQGLSAPLPVLVSPELRPVDDGRAIGTPQADGQRGGCEYISLCNGTAAPLWTWQPAQ